VILFFKQKIGSNSLVNLMLKHKVPRLFIYVSLCCCSASFASQIVIGLNWNKLIVWRYWEIIQGQPIEKMIILNREDIDMTLNIMLTRIVDSGGRIRTKVDSCFGIIGGPWEIPAKNYIIVNAPIVQGVDAKEYLLSFTKRDGQSLGLLHMSTQKPEPTFSDATIITTEGLNGSGGTFINCWWKHESISVKSGQQKTVQLVVMPMKNPSTKNEPRSIIIISKSAESQDSLSSLKLVEMNSKSLKFKNTERGIEYLIPWQKNISIDKATHLINIEIEAPIVTEPTMALLPIWHSTNVEGQNISLPILVMP